MDGWMVGDDISLPPFSVKPSVGSGHTPISEPGTVIAASFYLCRRTPIPPRRYFSQLRMAMCREAEPGFSSPTEMIDLVFHSPGRAREYLIAVSVLSIYLRQFVSMLSRGGGGGE